MWTKWVTIHESYGLPRAADECRRYLENRGIAVRLFSRQTKRSSHLYWLKVPEQQQRMAEELLRTYKKSLYG